MTWTGKTTSPRRTHRGRPDVTSHAAIERAAFELFAKDGFDGTTLDAIAASVGVSRRTLFNYFGSKNDIPWGQFDRTLDGFRGILAAQGRDVPVWEAVHRGVVEFNQFPHDANPSHRDRMRLILETPALQAHSVLRYEEWCDIIAEYVAARMTLRPSDLLPRVASQLSLGLALEAYHAWLAEEDADLVDLLQSSMVQLRTYLST